MSDNLEGKVYEIQMLKQHYGITSTDAHNLMTSRAAYGRLQNEVNSVLKPEGIQLQLSWQEISNLCQKTAFVVRDALNAAHFQRFGDFTYFTVREFNDDLLNDRKIPWAKYFPGKPGLCHRANYNKDVEFQFDYARFLNAFARAQKQGDRQKAFRQAFLTFRDSTDPYLISPKGERVSYPKFVETVATYGKAKPIEEITSELEIIAETANTLALNRQLVEDFREWQLTGSGNYDNSTIQFHKVTQEERQFLYGISNEDDPYERAIREKTLKQIDTERNIALHYILGNYELEGQGAAIIANALEELTEARDRRRKRFERLPTNTPKSILERSKLHFEKTQYTLNAVRKTKKWLEDILNK